MAAPSISFDTYDFTSLVEEPSFETDVRLPSETAPRRHGALITDEPTLEARVVRIRGRRFFATDTAARAELETMLATLMKGAAATARKRLTWYTGRYLNCYVTKAPWEWLPGTVYTAYRFEVEFFGDDPFWYSTTQTLASQLNPAAWAHANPSSMEMYPVWTIAADQGVNLANFTLTNNTTGKSFTFNGTVLAGNALVVDAAQLTVKNNGVAAPHQMSAASTIWLWLAPGANSLTLAGANATLTVAYYPRFYAP